jgi:hypothetical protein
MVVKFWKINALFTKLIFLFLFTYYLQFHKYLKYLTQEAIGSMYFHINVKNLFSDSVEMTCSSFSPKLLPVPQGSPFGSFVDST